MVASSCANCGSPLAANAAFCGACGLPTPSAAPPPPQQAVPPPPMQAAPPTGPSLAVELGLNGGRKFLLQHQLLSDGRNYRVLDQEKRHLFTVREDLRQEIAANFLQAFQTRSPPPQAGAHVSFHAGFERGPTRTFAWIVADASGTPRGAISIQVTGNNSSSTMVDASGTPVIAVNVHKGMVGGLDATAAYPDGRAMFGAKGNLLRHNFAIHDPAGAEVAKIHEAWASIRDTYNLDLTGNVEPLCPLIFAILIDREKQAAEQ